MPVTFQLDCPHCGTVHVGFELVAESRLPQQSDCVHVCAICNHCAGFVVLNVKSYYESDHTVSEHYANDPEAFKIVETYPTPVAQAPDHLPREVERLFKQGTDNVPANPDAAGTMFRKTIEATLRDKCPAATGKLNSRIKEAVSAGVLTADLAGYADTIRLEGNEAAHGTYDEDDAQQLRSFVTLVLQYVYTLPGKQAEIEAEAKARAPS